MFTHENLTNIPTLESKDDTYIGTRQLDDMAVSPSHDGLYSVANQAQAGLKNLLLQKVKIV